MTVVIEKQLTRSKKDVQLLKENYAISQEKFSIKVQNKPSQQPTEVFGSWLWKQLYIDSIQSVVIRQNNFVQGCEKNVDAFPTTSQNFLTEKYVTVNISHSTGALCREKSTKL